MEFENPTFDDRPDDRPDEDNALVDEPASRPQEESLPGTSTEAAAGERLEALRDAALQLDVYDFYKSMAKQGYEPQTGINVSDFVSTKKDGLRLKGFEEIQLVNRKTHRYGKKGEARPLAALRRERGGAALLEKLGLFPKEQETTFIENAPQPTFSDRERQGLDLALQRARGELENNLGKLRELDEHIVREKEKIATAQNDPSLAENISRLEAKLRDLELERAARLEAISANREALRTQTNRIRENFERLLDKDKTLGEKN